MIRSREAYDLLYTACHIMIFAGPIASVKQ